MKTYQIKKNQILELLSPYLERDSQLIAPSVNALGVVEFMPIHDIQEIVFNSLIPIKPPKSYIFPPSSVLVQFDSQNPVELNAEKDKFIARQALFGLKPCDLAAIAYMDDFFGSNITDTLYTERRSKTMIIGMACETPSNACFCTTMDIDPGFSTAVDIFLVPCPDGYFVEALSQKGQEHIDNLKVSWEEVSAEIVTKAKKVISEATSLKLIDKIDLSREKGKFNQIYEADFWKKYSDTCIVCGACTFDCPTCSCFDVSDSLKSSIKGCRYRSWDSCSFNDFSLHASGHNPRSSKLHRLRQRIMHKYQYSVEKMDTWSCTGCGRCIRVCPVGINTRSILKDAKEALGEQDR